MTQDYSGTPPAVPLPPAGPAAGRRGSGRGCLAAAFFGLLILLLLAAAAAALWLFAMQRSPVAGGGRGGVDEYPRLRCVWSCGGGEHKVVRIPVNGVLISEAGSSSIFSAVDVVRSALQQIQAATVDPGVRALILEIDSPGGGITACDAIYRALQDFKRSDPAGKRRIVALLGDVAASGGYYVAAAADHIIAHPTTVTGSIGVRLSLINVRELGRKLGVEHIVIKAGDMKDMGDPFKEMTAAERAVLEGIATTMHDHFVRIVADGRSLAMDKVMAAADGRPFTAAQALELELVDQVGYWEDAFDKCAELLDVDQIKVMRYEERFPLASLFRGTQEFRPTARNLVQWTQPRLLYLWRP